MDIHHVLVPEPGRPPYPLEQLAPGEGDVRPLGERVQSPLWSGNSAMGRVGFEPTTLGLKVGAGALGGARGVSRLLVWERDSVRPGRLGLVSSLSVLLPPCCHPVPASVDGHVPSVAARPQAAGPSESARKKRPAQTMSALGAAHMGAGREGAQLEASRTGRAELGRGGPSATSSPRGCQASDPSGAPAGRPVGVPSDVSRRASSAPLAQGGPRR